MLAATNLAVGYGTRVVARDVSFALARGETLAVLGGNGCGKTTLLRTLLGLLPRSPGASRSTALRSARCRTRRARAGSPTCRSSRRACSRSPSRRRC